MPDTPSITLVKSFSYRGAPEEWSNTYHFSGTTPSSDADWRALAVAIYTTEKACFNNGVTLVHAYGYNAGDDHSAAQIDFRTGTPNNVPGTLTLGGADVPAPGDVAAWMRALIGTSSKGKKVYIRKYFHGIGLSGGQWDQTSANTRTGLTAHAAAALSGSWPGGAKWCGPQAQVASLPTVSQFVTTRTLKRRGKRP